ncbi:hypothetical protein [Crateriforma conspicua]|uniref:HTH marR-type domain-containing protein n=1 Tax=Crateriforma conspicua TaxID=2527996 RepID=A0A5C5Y762_9PLAN|nr:hypothetical protein [Crateriforma conspicua]TWT71506.1 hypothetical protein Pan14r_38160 [Crateriforma conspicua]
MDDFTSRTADHMLDYLGSDGDPGWVFFRQFGEWECLYNLENDRKFVSRLARNLEERGLIEVRRIAEGTQLRMTDAGRQQVEQRQREDEENDKLIDWSELQATLDALPSEEEWMAKIAQEIAEEQATAGDANA